MSIDLEKIRREWLVECGPHDFGLSEFGCTCPQDDHRNVMKTLLDELERLYTNYELLSCSTMEDAFSRLETLVAVEKNAVTLGNDLANAYKDIERLERERTALEAEVFRLRGLLTFTPSTAGTVTATFRMAAVCGHGCTTWCTTGDACPLDAAGAGDSEQGAATTDHPENTCGRCGEPNVSWAAPSPLWNQVMRGGDINATELFDGIVCPTCFAILAEKAGVADRWRLSAERAHVPLQTVTPSGRVWNAQTWLWDDDDAPASVQGAADGEERA